MLHTHKVSGMSCSGCAHNIEEMLSEIKGVVTAKVDITTGTAQVEMKEHIGISFISDHFKNTKCTLMEI